MSKLRSTKYLKRNKLTDEDKKIIDIDMTKNSIL